MKKKKKKKRKSNSRSSDGEIEAELLHILSWQALPSTQPPSIFTYLVVAIWRFLTQIAYFGTQMTASTPDNLETPLFLSAFVHY